MPEYIYGETNILGLALYIYNNNLDTFMMWKTSKNSYWYTKQL